MDGIERDTTKHDRRLDDAMAAETRSLTTGSPVEAHRRDERLHEPVADGDPPVDPSARPGPSDAGAFRDDEAGVRRELARALAGRAEFPEEPPEA